MKSGWVKLHRQALEPTSSYWQLSMAQRGLFLTYLMIARYRPPFEGCLCDDDGTPWGARRRAQMARASRAPVCSGEQKMLKLRMITYRESGHLHISQFSHYQGGTKTDQQQSIAQTAQGLTPMRF